MIIIIPPSGGGTPLRLPTGKAGTAFLWMWYTVCALLCVYGIACMLKPDWIFKISGYFLITEAVILAVGTAASIILPEED